MISGQIQRGLRAPLFFAEVSINGNVIGSADAITPKPFECKFISDGINHVYQIYKQTSLGLIPVSRTDIQSSKILKVSMWNVNPRRSMWSANFEKSMWNDVTVVVDNKGQAILSSILEAGIEFTVTGTYY